jgi:signal transduction histidine kinase
MTHRKESSTRNHFPQFSFHEVADFKPFLAVLAIISSQLLLGLQTNFSASDLDIRLIVAASLNFIALILIGRTYYHARRRFVLPLQKFAQWVNRPDRNSADWISSAESFGSTLADPFLKRINEFIVELAKELASANEQLCEYTKAVDAANRRFVDANQDLERRTKQLEMLLYTAINSWGHYDAQSRAARASLNFFTTALQEIKDPLEGAVAIADFMEENIWSLLEAVENAHGSFANKKALTEQILRLFKCVDVARVSLKGIERLRFAMDVRTSRDIPNHESKPRLNFDAFLSAVLGKYVRVAEERGIEFVTEIYGGPNLRAMTDWVALGYAIERLVENALQFTDRGCIKLICQRRLSDEYLIVVLDIEDTGSGIDEVDQIGLKKRLDEAESPKYQSDTSGLIMASRIALELGGRVTLEWSHKRKGSCFRLTCKLSTSSRTYEESAQFLNSSLALRDREISLRLLQTSTAGEH